MLSDGDLLASSLVYSLSNISAKNYQNPLICIEVIVYYISVVF